MPPQLLYLEESAAVRTETHSAAGHSDSRGDIEARKLKLEGHNYWKENSHTYHWPFPLSQADLDGSSRAFHLTVGEVPDFRAFSEAWTPITLHIPHKGEPWD